MTKSRSALPLLGLALVPILALPPRLEAKSPCFPREGNCVITRVNGQPGRAATRKEKKAWLREFGEARYIDDVAFTLPGTVSGPLDIRADQTSHAGDWFGELVGVDIQVVPLQAIEVETERQQMSDPTVRVGGQAVVTEAEVLTDNRLPPGRYLLRVRLRGSDNWDRQTLFMTVVEEPEETP